ncbi:MAG: VanZ family protein [Chloroflexi bacterium]|nr:VanZ family protein [Chloroflexota bacterium]MBU1751912.1 VanZ family protein [Chloroflexota bacterium]
MEVRRISWRRGFIVLFGYWLPPLALMGLIFALSAQPTLPNPGQPGTWLNDVVAKVAHVVVYAALTGLLWRALARNRRPTAHAAFAALVLAALYGLTDELHQAFVPGREATLLDVGIDAGAALVTAWWLARRRGSGQ